MRDTLTLALLLGLAAVTRLYRLDLIWFTADQIRDVSIASAIAAGHAAPLLGPGVSLTEAFLGPFYFYLLAVAFVPGRDPLNAAYAIAAANIVGVVLCYGLVKTYFGRSVAVSATALFAVFPLAVLSARGIWNVGLLPPFVLLFVWALFALVVDRRSSALVALLALFGLLIQLHLTTIALGAVALVALVLFRPRVRGRHLALGVALFLVTLSPYLAYEIAHHFPNLRAMATFISADQGSGGRRPIVDVAISASRLYPSALAAVLGDDPWPGPVRAMLGGLHALEAGLFVLGLAVSVARLAAAWRAPTREAIPSVRSLSLLLLWLAVPILALANKKTAVWYWYLDVLYPAQFILAGIALASLGSTWRAPGLRRGVRVATTAALAAIVLSQALAMIAWQRRVDRRGEFTVGAGLDLSASARSRTVPSAAAVTLLPLAHRRGILEALSMDLGVAADDVPRVVHGAALEPAPDNAYLLRYLTSRPTIGPGRPRATDSRYLVTAWPDATSALDVRAVRRRGPYTVVEYRPRLDDRWRYVVAAPGRPASDWNPSDLPATGLGLDLRPSEALRAVGTLRAPADRQAVVLAVALTGPAPPADVRLEVNGSPMTPTHRRERYAVFTRTLEFVFDVTPAVVSGDNAVTLSIGGPARLEALDVHEGRSLP